MAVAGERLNPEGRVEFDRDTPRQAYTLAVPLELGGKRGRRLDVAEAAVRTTEAEIACVVAETRNAVRGAYFDLLIATRVSTLLDELQGLATRARDAAQQRFEAGRRAAARSAAGRAGARAGRRTKPPAPAARSSPRARGSTRCSGLPIDAPTEPVEPDLGAPVSFDAAMTAGPGRQRRAGAARSPPRRTAGKIALAQALAAPTSRRKEASRAALAPTPSFKPDGRRRVAISLPIFTSHKAGVTLEEVTLAQLTAEREAARVAHRRRCRGGVADRRARSASSTSAIATRSFRRRSRSSNMAEDAYRLGQTGHRRLPAGAAGDTRRPAALAAGAKRICKPRSTDLERAIGAPLLP